MNLNNSVIIKMEIADDMIDTIPKIVKGVCESHKVLSINLSNKNEIIFQFDKNYVDEFSKEYDFQHAIWWWYSYAYQKKNKKSSTFNFIQTFKFLAELDSDIENVLCEFKKNYKVIDTKINGNECEFSIFNIFNKVVVKDLVELIKTCDDCHVIEETINKVENYTGKRTFENRTFKEFNAKEWIKTYNEKLSSGFNIKQYL